ncbi:PREDICTED: carotenoid isomerooxygenase-like [Branchiostoma belcheri]|uniref:Carotenoid isomerooxygenase-like n=1 Tax=Branchiostoma belcheri TaxID=7741 RepID=A0A6P4ZM30_BRABE|nr:PREDICTED: carotenoid isomerooxygenase-like [Branchiostoma belcheri]
MAFYPVHVCFFILLSTTAILAATPNNVMDLFTTNLHEFQHVPMKYDSKNPIPKWLEGTLVRNAPAMFELGGRSAIHVFDGFAKIHSVEIGQQAISFSSAFLQTSAYTRSKKANLYAPSITFFGVDPAFSTIEKLEAFRYPYDNTDVNVWKYGQGNNSVYAALTDAWVYAEFDLDSLASKGVDIPEVSGVHWSRLVQSCAHPIVEPNTTNSINYLMFPSLIPGQKQQYYVLRIKDLGDFEILANFQSDKASYMHSFAVTKNYAVFFVQPAYFDFVKMVGSAMVGDAMGWFPDEKTQVMVVNLKTGKVETVETDPIFYTHHANAYETPDGKIVADVCQFEDGVSIFADYKLPMLRNLTTLHQRPSRSRLYRYTIDLANKSVQTKTFRSDDPLQDYLHTIDVPIINENYRGRHYCYLYGVVFDFSPSNALNGSFALVKKNLCTPGKDLFWYKPNHYVSEPSVVPNPEGKDEDDAVVLSAVFDAVLGKSYLLILDAKTIKPINTAYMPTYIPFGFHGKYFPKN